MSDQRIVPDDRAAIESVLRHWADDLQLHLVLTTGGTGLSPTDVTPEATLAVIDRLVPGLAEAMRQESLRPDAVRHALARRGWVPRHDAHRQSARQPAGRARMSGGDSAGVAPRRRPRHRTQYIAWRMANIVEAWPPLAR